MKFVKVISPSDEYFWTIYIMKFIFEKFAESDIGTRVLWINDPRIHSGIYVKYPTTVKDTRDWYLATSNDPTRIDLIVKSESGVALGMVGLTSISTVNSNAELYLMINPDLHGKGLGGKITRWVLNFGFSHYNLHKIYLYTDSVNVNAISVYRKIGFKEEGIQRGQRFKDGTYRDKVAFGMLRNEWLSKEWAEQQIKLSSDSVIQTTF